MTSLAQVNETSKTTNRIAQLLRLEPERFWRCWRRFDDFGRRYMDLVKAEQTE